MNKMLVWLGCWTVVGGVGLAGLARGQDKPAGGAPKVVVMDVTKVFENLTHFKTEIEQIATEAEQYEAGLKAQQQELMKKAETRKDFTPGTPDYKKIEEEMARMQSEMQMNAMLKRKEFLEREAKIYFKYYTQIRTTTKAFCDGYGVQLVLNYDSSSIDAGNRQSVQMGIRNPIVYQSNLDITTAITEQLNKLGPAPEVRISAAPTGPAAPAAPAR